ncbi:hypothetical protein BKA63DRAFT_320562 [Paraphoma chrysanthemicola]|nr:hypothetical protein BKA63DRAFT_320562 [Paraphoma chrysanthemicola]
MRRGTVCCCGSALVLCLGLGNLELGMNHNCRYCIILTLDYMLSLDGHARSRDTFAMVVRPGFQGTSLCRSLARSVRGKPCAGCAGMRLGP